MTQSNEFTGRTLAEAVRKATAAYERSGGGVIDRNQRRCNDLILEITSLKNAIARVSNEAERLADEAERLRESAAVELALSALLALGTMARALRGFALAYRRIKNRDVSKLTEREIVDLLNTLGPIGSALGALYALRQLREAQRLARRADSVQRNAETLGDQLLRAVSEYSRRGCGERQRLTS